MSSNPLKSSHCLGIFFKFHRFVEEGNLSENLKHLEAFLVNLIENVFNQVNINEISKTINVMFFVLREKFDDELKNYQFLFLR
jgi:hypothetical protein